MRPTLLDTFCKAGGASKGYMDAGFLVVGVDIEPQPNYIGHAFYQADALEFIVKYGKEFDAIAASPPCQRYTTAGNKHRHRGSGRALEHPDLIAPTRDALRATARPYVIENVMGARAEMVDPVRVCGSALGLHTQRHRLFECSFAAKGTGCDHRRPNVPVYGNLDGRRLWTRADGSEYRAPKSLAVAQAAMGIDWMSWKELTQAIPPAYTRYIGEQLIRQCFPNRTLTAAGIR